MNSISVTHEWLANRVMQRAEVRELSASRRPEDKPAYVITRGAEVKEVLASRPEDRPAYVDGDNAAGEFTLRPEVGELRQLRLFEKLTAASLERLCQSVELVGFRPGQTICRQDDVGHAMYVVVRGRVKVASQSPHGERVLRFLERDEHFGEMSVLTGSRRTAHVTAVTNTQLLRIDKLAFDALRQCEPIFCTAISETLANRLACSVRGDTRPPVNRSVAVLYAKNRGEQLVRRLRDELISFGASVKVIGSLTQAEGAERPLEYRQADAAEELQRLGERYDRVLVARTFEDVAENSQWIANCDRIICFLDPTDSAAAKAALERLIATDPKLAPRVHVVRWLGQGERFTTADLSCFDVTGLDFKMPSGGAGHCSATRQAWRRIVRFLFDQRLGIALGGGGARGLAHLGVLRALEEEDIGIDLISGTSMGALVGSSYAAGWSPRDAETLFREEGTPNLFFRLLPGGISWFMISKFRLAGWERMLRKYLQDVTFQQLQIPLCTVSADLVQGGQIIRETGDAVDAILESINLPYISRPIIRGEQVLVDGGILNNVPVDLLRPRGANLVIGVDVCSQLPQRIGRADKSGQMRRPSMLATAFRLNEIRRYHVSRTNISDADEMIRIDTSAFEFEDFTKAHQLAEAGYQAARASMPQIRKLVDDRLAQTLKAG